VSRNLGRKECYFCPGVPTIDGEPIAFAKYRPLWPDQKQYQGLKVAHATCPLCLAKYAAWLPWDDGSRYGWFRDAGPNGYTDLSFWSTFNDEPGREDLPEFEIKTTVTHERAGIYRGFWLEWFDKHHPRPAPKEDT
jgi:hypothetical protein